VGSFVVETLRERAQAVIKGTPEGTPLRTAPARIEDVADALLAAVDKHMASMEERLARAAGGDAAAAGVTLPANTCFPHPGRQPAREPAKARLFCAGNRVGNRGCTET
jgi:hypothetical protein